MTPAERKKALARMARYVKVLRRAMHLGHFHFIINTTPPESPEALATISLTSVRYSAVLQFSDDCLLSSDEEWRESLAHEMVHAHLMHLDRAVSSMEEYCGQQWGPLYDRYIDSMELGVDSLTTVLAPFLPLPGR